MFTNFLRFWFYAQFLVYNYDDKYLCLELWKQEGAELVTYWPL